MPLSPRFLALLAAEGLEAKRAPRPGLRVRVASPSGSLPGSSTPSGSTATPLRSRTRGGSPAEAGLSNVEFHEADVEREEYGRWQPDLVTAYLCASDAIVERAGRALAPGQCLAMVAFHVEQWQETGKVSRFAYDEARMERALRSQRLRAGGDRGRARGCALRLRGGRARGRGRASRTGGGPTGAGSATSRSSKQGGRTLTRAHLIVKARRS